MTSWGSTYFFHFCGRVSSKYWLLLRMWVELILLAANFPTRMTLLGKQHFLGQGTALVEAYKDAMRQQYGYLIIDLTANGDDTYCMRSKVFPGEDPWVYVLRNL